MDELDFDAIDAAVAVHPSTPPAASAGGSPTVVGGVTRGAMKPSLGPCGTATMVAARPRTLVGEASAWVTKGSGGMAAAAAPASGGGSSALPLGNGEDGEAAAEGKELRGGPLGHGPASAAVAGGSVYTAGAHYAAATSTAAGAEGQLHQEEGGSLGVKTVAGSKRPGGGLTAFGGAKRMPTSLM